MSERMFVVLLSRRDDGPWMIRNSRLSFTQKPPGFGGQHREYSHEEIWKLGEKQMLDWIAAEPGTQFKLVDVPYGHEYLK